MPAHGNNLKSIVTALALCLCSAGAHAQSGTAPLPILVPDSARPAPWPQATDGSTWVPVFMLGDGDGHLLASPFSAEPAGSVLLGVAQVRGRTVNGDDSISISPSLRWHLGDDLRLGAAMTVTDFVPCRSLVQSPMAATQTDACEDFAAQNNSAIGVSGSLSLGRAN